MHLFISLYLRVVDVYIRLEIKYPLQPVCMFEVAQNVAREN